MTIMKKNANRSKAAAKKEVKAAKGDAFQESSVQEFNNSNASFARETISPALAIELLANMAKNRVVRQSWVDQLTRIMITGEFDQWEGSPVRIDYDCKLMDGQHRLWALVESQTTWEFSVVRGLHPDTIYIIDTGKTRTLSDMLKIRGEKQPGHLASLIILMMAFERTEVLARYVGKASTRPTIGEALHYLDHTPTLRNSLDRTVTVRRRIHGGGARWAATHHIFSSIDADDADEFFFKIEMGQGLDAHSPILLLRQRVIDDANAVIKMREMDYTAIIIKSWNAWREGREMRLLTWRAGGRKPEPFPAPV